MTWVQGADGWWTAICDHHLCDRITPLPASNGWHVVPVTPPMFFGKHYCPAHTP